MTRQLLFKTIMMDSAPLAAGQSTYSFFTPSFENNPSVTAMVEGEALFWLLQNPQFRKGFFAEFFPQFPKAVRHFTGLVEPFTYHDKTPGDIDLLLVQPDLPHKAVAFEFKRIKVFREETGKEKINRIPYLAHGIEQSNGYHAIGFSQTYLVAIILDDGRHLETPNVMFRYNKDHALDEYVYNLRYSSDLHREVGVIYLRINQMTGKHIDHSHSIGYCIDKPAIPVIQPTDITSKIANLCARK